jgi:hypothetical protein
VNRARAGLCTLAGILGCSGAPPPAGPVPQLPPERVALTLYLIGDAGDPDSTGEPVLQSLRQELVSDGRERVVIFLGDNAYPRGLPTPTDPTRREEERRLSAQVRAVVESQARGYFVLGNHDWAKHGDDGWEAARRQEVYVDSLGAGRVALLPSGGCPGPSVVDVGTRLRLLLMDTQWWLHPGPKPDSTSNCPAADDEVVDSVRSAIAGAGARLVVVAGHHPLVTGGDHGGYFGWKDHLFPLRQVNPSLWIPLPLIGSLYPSARQQGISPQDIPSRAYQHFIAVFSRAFAGHAPALYAAGHDHNLQVIAGGAVPLELVSGGGIYGHNGRATRSQGTLFAEQASGFGRLDIPASGPARLAIVKVDRSGNGREVFSCWVKTSP